MRRFLALVLAPVLVAALLLVAFGGAARSASGASGEVVVGILEYPAPEQLESLQRKYGSRIPAVVRVAFKKESGRWQSFRSDFGDPNRLKAATQFFPTKMSWTIAFDGKPRGRIESATTAEWSAYGDIGDTDDLARPEHPANRPAGIRTIRVERTDISAARR